jgi:hypothetical protein
MRVFDEIGKFLVWFILQSVGFFHQHIYNKPYPIGFSRLTRVLWSRIYAVQASLENTPKLILQNNNRWRDGPLVPVGMR